MEPSVRKLRCPDYTNEEQVEGWDYIHVSKYKSIGDTLTYPILITLPPKYQQGKKAIVQLVYAEFWFDFGSPAGAWTNPVAFQNKVEVIALNSTPSYDEDGKPSNVLALNGNGNNASSNGTYNFYYSQLAPAILGFSSYASITTTSSEIWLAVEWINNVTNARHTCLSSEAQSQILRLRCKLLE